MERVCIRAHLAWDRAWIVGLEQGRSYRSGSGVHSYQSCRHIQFFLAELRYFTVAAQESGTCHAFVADQSGK